MNKHDERGMVSIMVTFIIMIVITITVLSFAQVIRREQRQALDNQLSSQAFYAAESGINQVRNIIKKKNGTVVNKSTCNDEDYQSEPLTKTISSAYNVSFTCLLVDRAPESITAPLSPDTSSFTSPIKPDRPMTSFTIEWTPSTTDDPLAGCPESWPPAQHSLTPSDDWPCKGYGVLRVDIVQLPTVGNITRSTLAGNAYQAFIRPSTVNPPLPAPSLLPDAGAGGRVVNARCTDGSGGVEAKCRYTLTVPNTTANYYMRVLTLYRTTNLTIKGNGPGGTVRFNDSQVMIDATGKAQDVLRRIQVRVPLSSGDHADYGIQASDSVCKQFKTYYPTTAPITPRDLEIAGDYKIDTADCN